MPPLGFFKLIEEKLKDFIAYYNLHEIRTEKMRPPVQLFHSGLQNLILKAEEEGIDFPELQQVRFAFLCQLDSPSPSIRFN